MTQIVTPHGTTQAVRPVVALTDLVTSAGPQFPLVEVHHSLLIQQLQRSSLSRQEQAEQTVLELTNLGQQFAQTFLAIMEVVGYIHRQDLYPEIGFVTNDHCGGLDDLARIVNISPATLTSALMVDVEVRPMVRYLGMPEDQVFNTELTEEKAKALRTMARTTSRATDHFDRDLSPEERDQLQERVAVAMVNPKEALKGRAYSDNVKPAVVRFRYRIGDKGHGARAIGMMELDLDDAEAMGKHRFVIVPVRLDGTDTDWQQVYLEIDQLNQRLETVGATSDEQED